MILYLIIRDFFKSQGNNTVGAMKIQKTENQIINQHDRKCPDHFTYIEIYYFTNRRQLCDSSKVHQKQTGIIVAQQ